MTCGPAPVFLFSDPCHLVASINAELAVITRQSVLSEIYANYLTTTIFPVFFFKVTTTICAYYFSLEKEVNN